MKHSNAQLYPVMIHKEKERVASRAALCMKSTQNVRSALLQVAGATASAYSAILFHGSGSFAMESTLLSSVSRKDKLLICSNGKCGEQLTDMAKQSKLSHTIYKEPWHTPISSEKIAAILKKSPDISHLALVHCEGTTGIINNIESIGKVCAKYGVTFIVNGIYSFGGIYIPMREWGVDFLVSSSNYCLQGTPGIAFVIARSEKLIACQDVCPVLSLDLYDQWAKMQIDGLWRSTPPYDALDTLKQALDMLDMEGGCVARQRRYTENQNILAVKLQELGFIPYIAPSHQSPVSIVFTHPDNRFPYAQLGSFAGLYGISIDTVAIDNSSYFRIHTFGETYIEEILKTYYVIKVFMDEHFYTNQYRQIL